MTECGPVKRVVILTAGFGDGHNTAARNVAEALELTSDEVKVEVVDVFQRSLGIVNDILKKSYSGLARYAPCVWGGVYALLDSSQRAESRLIRFGSLKRSLGTVLDEAQPDCVVSTYPVYSHIIQEIYKEHSERPFRLVTVITDSISVNSSWYRAHSDYFCVPNDATARVLLDNQIPENRIRAFGFPVSPTFAALQSEELTAPGTGGPIKILYIINTGKKKAGRALDRLLEIPNTQLTITAVLSCKQRLPQAQAHLFVEDIVTL